MQRTQIGRTFCQNLVAGVDQQPADQIQRLLRPGGDQHVLGMGEDAVARHMLHDQLTQRQVALGGAVLESLGRHLAQYLVGSGLKRLSREDFRRRQAAGKGNHISLLG